MVLMDHRVGKMVFTVIVYLSVVVDSLVVVALIGLAADFIDIVNFVVVIVLKGCLVRSSREKRSSVSSPV